MPTVFLVGIDQLDQIPDFLDLGAIVVVAPDRRTLQAWTTEREADSPEATPDQGDTGGVVVDLAARRVSYRGLNLALSDMEFRVLAALVAHPGHALSAAKIRRIAWGDEPLPSIDAYSIRSLIQRLRVRLRAAGAPITITAVRGFGFRSDVRLPAAPERPAALAAMKG